MKRRRPPIKPFEYGRYIIEYREPDSKLVRFYKERIDNYDDAEKAKERLLSEGVIEPEIKRVG
jgi:hypothetical protein|tara:strand:- start:1891 stop:2079 length:189 start_codon:yes stop_codon:yes gene_type:complete